MKIFAKITFKNNKLRKHCKIKIPYGKLFLIKKLTVGPRAVVYLLTYLFLSFVHHLSTNVDTNWNVRVFGWISWLFSNSKGGIIGMGVFLLTFLLVKAIIYFAYFLLLEYLFNKLNKIDISSKEFWQVVADKTFSLNGRTYKVRKVVLVNKLKSKKVLGKLVVCEDDFANDFEVGLSANINSKDAKQIKEKVVLERVSGGKTGIIMPLVLSLIIVLAFSPFV